MPSKVVANSIFEKNEIASNFHISGLGPSQFGINVWVHVLMLDAKYEED